MDRTAGVRVQKRSRIAKEPASSGVRESQPRINSSGSYHGCDCGSGGPRNSEPNCAPSSRRQRPGCTAREVLRAIPVGRSFAVGRQTSRNRSAKLIIYPPFIEGDLQPPNHLAGAVYDFRSNPTYPVDSGCKSGRSRSNLAALGLLGSRQQSPACDRIGKPTQAHRNPILRVFFKTMHRRPAMKLKMVCPP